ncbi:MAG: type II secretion system F family protein [Dehalococcoidales bacterium]|nr:type II secretion system F family protein [Dehalococcoidales bacterium]
MTYRYQAYTSDKKIVKGVIEAASESLAEDALYRAGYERIISLEEVTRPSFKGFLQPGVPVRHIIDFSSQLATLLGSGIGLVTALDLLAEQITQKTLRKTVEDIARRIRGGSSFSDALSQHPALFNQTYCQVIRASEQTGRLDIGLKQAAGYLEKRLNMAQKIRRAMVYPSFVLITAVLVVILLLTVALPPLLNLFQSLNAPLPWTTRFLMAVAGFLLDNGLYLLLALAVIVLGAILLLRLPSVKLKWDAGVLKLPLIGNVITELNLQSFCQTTALLLQAGVRLPAILELVSSTGQNSTVCRVLGRVRERLIQGEGLSRPMAETGFFPPLMVEMVMIGEKSGTLDTTLGTLADYYAERVSRRIDTLITAIEPTLTIIVGLAVIFIALSMITPLYTILRAIR